MPVKHWGGIWVQGEATGVRRSFQHILVAFTVSKEPENCFFFFLPKLSLTQARAENMPSRVFSSGGRYSNPATPLLSPKHTELRATVPCWTVSNRPCALLAVSDSLTAITVEAWIMCLHWFSTDGTSADCPSCWSYTVTRILTLLRCCTSLEYVQIMVPIQRILHKYWDSTGPLCNQISTVTVCQPIFSAPSYGISLGAAKHRGLFLLVFFLLSAQTQTGEFFMRD